jgi:hypothetical protein
LLRWIAFGIAEAIKKASEAYTENALDRVEIVAVERVKAARDRPAEKGRPQSHSQGGENP